MQVDGLAMIDTLAAKGWRKSNGKQMSNVDLWLRIYEWVNKCSNNVQVQHVRVDDYTCGNSLPQRLLLRVAIKRYADLLVTE